MDLEEPWSEDELFAQCLVVAETYIASGYVYLSAGMSMAWMRLVWGGLGAQRGVVGSTSLLMTVVSCRDSYAIPCARVTPHTPTDPSNTPSSSPFLSPT